MLTSSTKLESDKLCSFTLKDEIDLAAWHLVWGYRYQRKNPLEPWNPSDVFFKALEDKEMCDFKFDSPLLKRIWNQILLGWVDIENEYYSLLKTEKMTMDNRIVQPDFKKLNEHLDILRNNLIQYLKLETENKPTTVINDIADRIYRPIKAREISVAYTGTVGDIHTEEKEPSAIMMLNFNYTSTPEQYVSDPSKVTINYIHGKLENPESVIFGYGDELDFGFNKLKNMNDNEALRNIKSIRYLESDNYRKMLEFIESAPFQLCIMGHSCGNSDRTLLNTLFEHRNCVSIRPYYYVNEEKDNYMDLAMNISRNFTDMKLMRDRVVNKEYCEPLVERAKE